MAYVPYQLSRHQFGHQFDRHLLLSVSMVTGAHGQEALPWLAWMTVDEGAILFAR